MMSSPYLFECSVISGIVPGDLASYEFHVRSPKLSLPNTRTRKTNLSAGGSLWSRRTLVNGNFVLKSQLKRMTRMRTPLVLAGLFLLIGGAALAQDGTFPKVELAPTFMYVHTPIAGQDFNCVGGSGALAYNFTSMIDRKSTRLNSSH